MKKMWEGQQSPCGQEIIRTTRFWAAIYFPVVWFLILSIQAVRENSASIYFDAGLYGLLVPILAVLDAYIQYTIINYELRSVLIKEAIGLKHTIAAGACVSISNHKLVFAENGETKTVRLPFLYYWPKDTKKIINAIVKFSPHAKTDFT